MTACTVITVCDTHFLIGIALFVFVVVHKKKIVVWARGIFTLLIMTTSRTEKERN